MVRKHGHDAFVKEILSLHESARDLDVAERNLITQDVLDESLNLNIVLGGDGGPLSREAYAKLLASLKNVDQRVIQNRPEEKARNSRNQKIAQNRDDVVKKKRQRMLKLFRCQEIKLKHKVACNSDAFKEAQRKHKLGTKWIHKGPERLYVAPNQLQEYLSLGWVMGMGPRNVIEACEESANHVQQTVESELG